MQQPSFASLDAGPSALQAQRHLAAGPMLTRELARGLAQVFLAAVLCGGLLLAGISSATVTLHGAVQGTAAPTAPP